MRDRPIYVFFRFLIQPHVTEASGSGDIIPVTPYIGFRRR